MNASTGTPLRWDGATIWWGGDGALEAGLSGMLYGRVLLVVDKGFSATSQGQAFLQRFNQSLKASGGKVNIWLHDATQTDVIRVRKAATIWERDPPDVYVFMGGGATIDFGLLATLNREQREVSGFDQGRCGLVLVPPAQRGTDRPFRVAIPTTLGTGAEMSNVACVDRFDGKLLVISSDLRPDVAICDPKATAGLHLRQLREAIIEILARLIVPFAAPGQGYVNPLAYDLSDDLLVGNLQALLRVNVQLGLVGFLEERERLTLAAVSSHSHSGWVHLGRTFQSSPLWFVATELSQVLSVSKATATALLLPSWASAVSQGNTNWGSATRLRELSTRVLIHRDSFAEHGENWLKSIVCALLPAHECYAQIDLSKVDDVAREVSNHCIRRWGGGLPMLIGLTAQDVEVLVADALLACA